MASTASMARTERAPAKTPVFLLKTRSTPGDAYEDLFSTSQDGFNFEPVFVPVLEHKFDDSGMAKLQYLLQEGLIGNRRLDSSYGGLIFTSQRAVEAFAKLVEDGSRTGAEGWPHLQDIPIYSVGPATTRALRAVLQVPPLNVLGEHTGNGESLAQFILQDYGERCKANPTTRPLLFLVGEQRRDVIPKALMDENLLPEKKIHVDEVVVYGTGVMESFRQDFSNRLKETADRVSRWVVVFSPTGCESMLRALDMLDETGRAKPKAAGRKIFIATIGPTTQAFLMRTFGMEPDVSAEKPSPEGIWEAITQFEIAG